MLTGFIHSKGPGMTTRLPSDTEDSVDLSDTIFSSEMDGDSTVVNQGLLVAGGNQPPVQGDNLRVQTTTTGANATTADAARPGGGDDARGAVGGQADTGAAEAADTAQRLATGTNTATGATSATGANPKCTRHSVQFESIEAEMTHRKPIDVMLQQHFITLGYEAPNVEPFLDNFEQQTGSRPDKLQEAILSCYADIVQLSNLLKETNFDKELSHEDDWLRLSRAAQTTSEWLTELKGIQRVKYRDVYDLDKQDYEAFFKDCNESIQTCNKRFTRLKAAKTKTQKTVSTSAPFVAQPGTTPAGQFGSLASTMENIGSLVNPTTFGNPALNRYGPMINTIGNLSPVLGQAGLNSPVLPFANFGVRSPNIQTQAERDSDFVSAINAKFNAMQSEIDRLRAEQREPVQTSARSFLTSRSSAQQPKRIKPIKISNFKGEKLQYGHFKNTFKSVYETEPIPPIDMAIRLFEHLEGDARQKVFLLYHYDLDDQTYTKMWNELELYYGGTYDWQKAISAKIAEIKIVRSNTPKSVEDFYNAVQECYRYFSKYGPLGLNESTNYLYTEMKRKLSSEMGDKYRSYCELREYPDNMMALTNWTRHVWENMIKS